MLAHCLENGVSVLGVGKSHEVRRQRLQISEGVVVDESIRTNVTEYTIRNKKEENFKMVLEHTRGLGENSLIAFDSEQVEIAETEKTSSNNWRVYFDLAPSETVTLTATESCLERREVGLGWGNVSGYMDAINPLKENPVVKECCNIQDEIVETSRLISENNKRVSQLSTHMARVQESLESAKDVKGVDAQAVEWVKELDQSQKSIREIEEHLTPKLVEKRNDLQRKLNAKLAELQFKWSEEPKPTADKP
jgi:hypothetical protein